VVGLLETWRSIVLVFWMASVLAGCSGDTGLVTFDLCPARSSTDQDLADIRSATQWTLTVWGLREGDVTWTESWSNDGGVAGLSREAMIPVQEEVRLNITGWSTSIDGRRHLKAVASSDELTLSPNVRVCLCVAPPEEYDDLCTDWRCTINASTGVCWQ
jgi:hypothetical protein